MDGVFVVNGSPDAVVGAERAELVPVGDPHDVLVEHVPRPVGRRPNEAPRETAVVGCGDRRAASVVLGEVTEPDPQERCLELVQAAVEPRALRELPAAPAVLADWARRVEDRWVARDDCPAVADRPEVLRRIEAERGGVAPRSGCDPVERRAVRLRAVLDHRQAEALAMRQRLAMSAIAP